MTPIGCSNFPQVFVAGYICVCRTGKSARVNKIVSMGAPKQRLSLAPLALVGEHVVVCVSKPCRQHATYLCPFIRAFRRRFRHIDIPMGRWFAPRRERGFCMTTGLGPHTCYVCFAWKSRSQQPTSKKTSSAHVRTCMLFRSSFYIQRIFSDTHVVVISLWRRKTK